MNEQQVKKAWAQWKRGIITSQERDDIFARSGLTEAELAEILREAGA